VEAPVIPLSTPTAVKKFPYYAIAATITVLLLASVIGYFFYSNSPSTHVAVNNNPDRIQSEGPTMAVIPFARTRESGELGFGEGDKQDTTITILIYKTEKRDRSYQFDDTLRLYGTFSHNQLILSLDQKTGQYTLLDGAVPYALQRYQPQQPLRATR
jgi:hypothetical protein